MEPAAGGSPVGPSGSRRASRRTGEHSLALLAAGPAFTTEYEALSFPRGSSSASTSRCRRAIGSRRLIVAPLAFVFTLASPPYAGSASCCPISGAWLPVHVTAALGNAVPALAFCVSLTLRERQLKESAGGLSSRLPARGARRAQLSRSSGIPPRPWASSRARLRSTPGDVSGRDEREIFSLIT
jgi:hypothetical protein